MSLRSPSVDRGLHYVNCKACWLLVEHSRVPPWNLPSTKEEAAHTRWGLQLTQMTCRWGGQRIPLPPLKKSLNSHFSFRATCEVEGVLFYNYISIQLLHLPITIPSSSLEDSPVNFLNANTASGSFLQEIWPKIG